MMCLTIEKGSKMNRFDRITINPALVNGQPCIVACALPLNALSRLWLCIRTGMSCFGSNPNSMLMMFARRWILPRAIWMTM